jgi:hypothetical protein
MKKLLFIIIMLGLGLGSTFASSKTSSLTIRASGNENISVAIGEMPFSDAAHEVTIRNLKKGKHFVRVMKHSRGVFRSKSEIVYEGYITIQKKREIVAVIDENRTLMIVQNEKRRKNSPYYETDKNDQKREVKVTLQLGKVLSLF